MSEYTRGCYCPICGREIDTDEKICHACGASLNGGDFSASNTEKKSGNWYQAAHKPSVFSIITAAISLLLIIFAFCPFISVKTNYGEKSSFATSFSPVEMIKYTAKSFTPYGSDKALAKSKEYKDFEKAYQKASSISFTKKLSNSDKEKLEDFIKSAIMLDLVGPENNIKVNLVAAAAASLTYIALALMAFVASIIAIIKSLLFDSDVERYTRYASRKLGSLALSMPIFILILAQASKFSHGSYSLGFGTAGVGVAWGLIAALVPILIISLYAAAKCYSKMQCLNETHAKSNAKTRLVIMALLIASVVAVFLPTISVSCASPKTKRKTVKETEYVSISDIYEISSVDSDYYSEIINSDESLIYAAEQVSKGKGEAGAGALLLHSVIFSEGNLSALYVFITIFAVNFMLLALTLLRRYVTAFLNGGAVINPERHLKFTILFAVFFLASSLGLSMFANTWISVDASYYLLFNLGIGPILALVFSFCAHITLRLRQEKDVTAEKFDNPDVSSAPYVIN